MKYITNPPYLLVKSQHKKPQTEKYVPHLSFVGRDKTNIEVYNLLATTEAEGEQFKLKKGDTELIKKGGEITDEHGYHKNTNTEYTLKEIFDHYELMGPPVTVNNKFMAYFYFKLKPGLETSVENLRRDDLSGGSRKLKKKTKKLKRK